MSDFIISSFYEKMADVKFDAYGILGIVAGMR